MDLVPLKKKQSYERPTRATLRCRSAPNARNQLRAAGETVKDEDIARTWPLLHAHIIPNGMYDFSSC